MRGWVQSRLMVIPRTPKTLQVGERVGWEEWAGQDEEFCIDQGESEDWTWGYLRAVTPSVHGAQNNVLS